MDSTWTCVPDVGCELVSFKNPGEYLSLSECVDSCDTDGIHSVRKKV